MKITRCFVILRLMVKAVLRRFMLSLKTDQPIKLSVPLAFLSWEGSDENDPFGFQQFEGAVGGLSSDATLCGERHYLWRAVDHEGEVLETNVTKRRDRKAALRFLSKAMKRYGSPRRLINGLFFEVDFGHLGGERLARAAASIDQRNTCLEMLGRSFVVERFAAADGRKHYPCGTKTQLFINNQYGSLRPAAHRKQTYENHRDRNC